MNSEENKEKRSLKVLVLQYKPVYKEAEKSMDIADKLLEKYNAESNLDVVVLPEMAFIGYKFDNKEDISPYLEEANSGKTFEWCSKTAKAMGGYIFGGYGEKEGDKMYNSQLVVDPEGEFVRSYKKSFLFETDETWADEGPGFEHMTIKNRAGKEVVVGNGIGMDINPYQFKADFEKMEFANYHNKNNVEVILFSSNWVDSELDKVEDSKAVNSTLNYWAYRLLPFLKPEGGKKSKFLAIILNFREVLCLLK